MISGLPGKAWRILVESQGLPSDLTCILKAVSGKLDIKRCEPGFLVISLFTSLFALQTKDYDVIISFPVNSTSLIMSFKKCNIMMT